MEKMEEGENQKRRERWEYGEFFCNFPRAQLALQKQFLAGAFSQLSFPFNMHQLCCVWWKKMVEKDKNMQLNIY